MHVIFVDSHKFFSIYFLNVEYFGKLSKSNLSHPFTDLLNSPLGNIMNFSLEGNKKVVSWGKFDNLFLGKMMEDFGFDDLVLLVIGILHETVLHLSGLLFKIANETLILVIKKIGLPVSDCELNDFLLMIEFY